MRGAEMPHFDRGWEGRQPAVTARLAWCGSASAHCTLARGFVSVIHFTLLPVSLPLRLTAALCRLQDRAMAAAAGRSGGAGAAAAPMSRDHRAPDLPGSAEIVSRPFG